VEVVVEVAGREFGVAAVYCLQQCVVYEDVLIFGLDLVAKRGMLKQPDYRNDAHRRFHSLGENICSAHAHVHTAVEV